MRRFWYIPILCLFALASCGGTEEEIDPEDTEEPPPPTAEEIALEIGGALNPFRQFMAPGVVIPPVRITEGVNNVRNVKTKHQATENGPEGVRKGAVKAQEMLQEAYGAEAWGVVLFAYRALEVLDASATENYQRQLRWATIQVNRPQVAISTIWIDETQNIPTVICKVYAPANGQTADLRLGIGEEWRTMAGDQEYGIRLEELIGQKKGATFTYLQTEEQFDVYVGN